MIDFLSATAPIWSLNGPNLLEEHMYGSPAFFSLFVQVDDKNSSRYVAKVSIPVNSTYNILL